MMNNNINKKRERDEKPIAITLGKLKEGYYYISDTLIGNSRIKIPIGEATQQEISHFPPSTRLSLDQHESKKEKSDKGSVTNSGIRLEQKEISRSEGQATMNGHHHHYNDTMDHEDIPTIAKISEKINKQTVILPSCASWFNFEEIHEIEMKALPEYFCGKFPSKNPETYKEYRNFIINLYRENPNSYLTATGKKLFNQH